MHEFSTYEKVRLVEKSEEEFQLWSLGIDVYMKQTVRIGVQTFCKVFIVFASIQPFPDRIICDLCIIPSDLPSNTLYGILISFTHAYVLCVFLLPHR